ncbi:RadC family protein [Pedobacter glucosidilyticus]|uniref:RadC family protein n=1 Tax=Pedobacter glucosidilyticus TaxID=1122941 RepID=UPI00041427C9|nr:DNA repair protein RadC [Pedobacter glucosidilyticus]
MKSTYEQKMPITTWAEEDRPREKLLAQGRRVLSDAELIAILIGSGSRSESAVDLSKRILNTYQNNLDALGKLSVQELSKFKGIGEAKAISIIAALELGRRRKEADVPELTSIYTPSDIFNVLESYFADLMHEEFWIILLNKRNAILNKILISKGGLAGTVADPKIIFKAALEHHAASIILAHNHPSGNLKPSSADIRLTKKIVDAGALLDISILDHVIFCDKKFFSFSDAGMI